jgi:glycosyltransferase involved in cell wall biosynthesis
MNLIFSFIIPALNEEDLIAGCIKSIKRQKKVADEIIVVDNGSKDKTAEIARKLGCKVVKEEKRGISHARNKGAKLAKGDILCFIDADGVLSKNWSKEARKVLSNKKVQAVDGLIVFSHQNILKRIWYNTYTIVVYSGIVLSKMFLSRHFFTGNNMAIKRGVFEELGGFEPVVDEQIWLSKKFWKLSNNRGVFNPRMIIHYSARGFDSLGYLKTICYWVKAFFVKVSQDGYHYKGRKS